MVESEIWFRFSKENDIPVIQIDTSDLSMLKLTLENYSNNLDIISNVIKLFNSEIEWNLMWDIDTSIERFNNHHHLYLFLKKETPIGHVWYNGGYLYNAFVSNQRVGGESQWFIQETIKDRFLNGDSSVIELYVDDWNHRAINFWQKLNFTQK